jgi:hypothetical protein
MPIRHLQTARYRLSILLKGSIDASLEANLPASPVGGDTYQVTVAGDFGGSTLIFPAGAYFDVSNYVSWNDTTNKWDKIDTTENISDAAYDASGWDGDTRNAPSKNAMRDKIVAMDASIAVVSNEADNIETAVGLNANGTFIAHTTSTYMNAATTTKQARELLDTALNGHVTATGTAVHGLGTMSTQNANNVAITGGAIDGTTIGAATAAAITGTTITAGTQLIVPVGSNGTPSIVFFGDPDTGIFETANVIYMVAGGGNVCNFGTSGLSIQSGKHMISSSFKTADNVASMAINLPVSGTDAILHTVTLAINGTSFLEASATGNGAGSVGVKTINIGTTAEANVIHMGGATALVDITDAHWSITEAGVLSIVSMGANWTNAGRTIADLGIVTTVDINGGSIDGATIGGASAAAATFTTANATTFDTNVAAAGVTLSGSTLAADGTDANIDVTVTPKGTGSLSTSKLTTSAARVVAVNPITTAAGTTAGATTDHVVTFTGTTTHTYTLPACATGRELRLCNQSTGAITVNRAGADTIGTAGTSLTLNTDDSVILVGSGTVWMVF